jgi:hypothetical protein
MLYGKVLGRVVRLSNFASYIVLDVLSRTQLGVRLFSVRPKVHIPTQLAEDSEIRSTTDWLSGAIGLLGTVPQSYTVGDC